MGWITITVVGAAAGATVALDDYIFSNIFICVSDDCNWFWYVVECFRRIGGTLYR